MLGKVDYHDLKMVIDPALVPVPFESSRTD
jgi:hypothetical protein